MKLATYVIAQGDSLDILAQQLLGDGSQEDMLIQINRLRYPYLSDNPIDQYARPKGSLYLTSSVQDPNGLTFSNPNSIAVAPYDTVFLSQGASYGAAVVSSVSGQTLTFDSQVSGAFDPSALVVVFPNQQNIVTQVLRTGDTLLYPLGTATSTGAIAPSYALAMGTDWQLDEQGFLTKANGDIALVSGFDNLNQALRMRLQTPLGGLPLHLDYGNELFDILGEAEQTYFKSLVAYYIQECVRQDTRVLDAKVTDLVFSQDRVQATLSYTTIGVQGPINQPIAIPIGGIG